MKKISTLFALALACCSTASAQWNTDNTPFLVSGKYTKAEDPKMGRTTDGKTYIAWRVLTNRQFKYYLQMLDKDGNIKFGADALTVDNHKSPSWGSEWSLAVTDDGCAVVSLADSRTEDDSTTLSNNTFIPAYYKIDAEQNYLWGLDGITMTGVTKAPMTTAWVVGDDVYVNAIYDFAKFNRINSDGTFAFPIDSLSFSGEIIKSVGSDYIAIYAGSDGVSAMRYDRDHNAQWKQEAVLSSYSYGGHDLRPYKVASDGNGGAYVAFVRNMGSFSHMITVQHVNASGEVMFGLNSVDAYGAEEYDHDYCMMAGSSDKGLTVWAYKGASGTYSILAQQFSENGDREWGSKGLAIDTKTSQSGYAFKPIGCASLSNGDWIIAYVNQTGWQNGKLWVVRYDRTGKQIWKTQVGDAGDFTDGSLIVEEDASYLTWKSDEEGVYAVRIYNDGTFVKKATDPGNAWLVENFDYEAGDLYNQNGWLKWGAGTKTETVNVVDTNLTYPGYKEDAAGKCVALRNVQKSYSLQKQFAEAPVTSGSVYMGALINVQSVGDGTCFMSLTNNKTGAGSITDTSYGMQGGCLYLTKPSEGEGFNLGIYRTRKTEAVYAPATYELNKTYLVVLKYEFVEGDKNDVISLWVNPTDFTNEPEATISSKNGSFTSQDLANLQAVILAQNSMTRGTYPELKVDAIHVAGTWADLFPGGTTGIKTVNTEDSAAGINGSTAVKYYTLSGYELSAPQKGINIVKFANGQTRKVVIK